MRVFLFPGQGSQSVGMGADFYRESAAARAVFDAAEAHCGAGFLDSIFTATEDALKDTRLQQVALLTVEVAIAAHLKDAGCAPAGCAGHSLGEFSALVVARALAFEDALDLVRLRGRLMAEETPEGAMAAVIGLDPAAIEAALPGDVAVANYNGPGQTIISGSVAGIEAAESALKAAGAKRVLRLPVSGPFHSPLMRPAADAFAPALEAVAISPPQSRFVSSVTAQDETEPAAIRAALIRQICAPVQWTGVMSAVGSVPAVEAGPGRVLQGLAKRTDGAPAVEPAGTIEAAQALTGSA